MQYVKIFVILQNVIMMAVIAVEAAPNIAQNVNAFGMNPMEIHPLKQ